MRELPPTESPAFALEIIARQLQHWIDYDKAARGAEGLECPPDTHIVAPPCLPTYGTTENWIAALREAQDAILTTPSTTASTDQPEPPDTHP